MKKSILNLEGVQILSKTQQKNTFGGLADGGGEFDGGESGGGTCQALVGYSGDGEPIVSCNLSNAQAKAAGIKWCCSSCSTTSWSNC